VGIEKLTADNRQLTGKGKEKEKDLTQRTQRTQRPRREKTVILGGAGRFVLSHSLPCAFCIPDGFAGRTRRPAQPRNLSALLYLCKDCESSGAWRGRWFLCDLSALLSVASVL